jgi:hypothetical protein
MNSVRLRNVGKVRRLSSYEQVSVSSRKTFFCVNFGENLLAALLTHCLVIDLIFHGGEFEFDFCSAKSDSRLLDTRTCHDKQLDATQRWSKSFS